MKDLGSESGKKIWDCVPLPHHSLHPLGKNIWEVRVGQRPACLDEGTFVIQLRIPIFKLALTFGHPKS